MPLPISNNVVIPDSEIDIQFVRSQGSGGQNVNKNSTAAHLFFDIRSSSLPEIYKSRLFKSNDGRITKDGVVVIKAQEFRTQESNREEALKRLQEILRSAGKPVKKRKPTRPTRSSQRRRVENKRQKSNKKNLRGKVDY